MYKRLEQTDKTLEAYKTLSKIPSILDGKLNRFGNRVSSIWSVRNLDKGKVTKYMYNYTLNDKLGIASESQFGVDVSNELFSVVSPRETFKAVIREEKSSESDKKQYLEVWFRNSLTLCIDLTALNIHGDVYADSNFGNLDWSSDETSIVYVAEKKLKKSEPYITRKVEKEPKFKVKARGEDHETAKGEGEEQQTVKGEGEPAQEKGEEYVYRQDWGEQMVGKHLSVIVVYFIATERFSVLQGLPDSWCPGQVQFSPDNKCILGAAWETEPYRLGLWGCTNRPSFIFELTLDGKLIKYSEGASVRSPRFSPRGDLVWLQRETGGAHLVSLTIVGRKLSPKLMPCGQDVGKHPCANCTVVRNCPYSADLIKIVDVVETEVKTEDGDSFYGVYCNSLPARAFSDDGKRLLFSTPQQTEIKSFVVDFDTGKVRDISNKSSPQSTTILDVRNNVILAVCSNITTPQQLYVARLPAPGQESAIKWIRISNPSAVPVNISGSTVHYMQLQHMRCTDKVKLFSAIYVEPNVQGRKVPMVVWPHDGPHLSFVNEFRLETALFAMLGYGSLLVNYRGSSGTGDASIRFLLKHVGGTDVDDCKYATEVAVKIFSIDKGSLCLYGESHGGFIVSHLSGKYPDLYKVVVSKNPVINMATMVNSTDTPDWCVVESGFEFSAKSPISEGELLFMGRLSPINHVHAVKAPTAMMLGSKDKRVPYNQGLDFARRLKLNGIKTRVYVYEDDHNLSSVPVEMDSIINTARWFIDHLPP